MLHGPTLEIERCATPHSTRSQKGDIANHRPGDDTIFHHDVYGVRAKAEDACRVAKVDAGEGSVALSHSEGREQWHHCAHRAQEKSRPSKSSFPDAGPPRLFPSGAMIASPLEAHCWWLVQ